MKRPSFNVLGAICILLALTLLHSAYKDEQRDRHQEQRVEKGRKEHGMFNGRKKGVEYYGHTHLTLKAGTQGVNDVHVD